MFLGVKINMFQEEKTLILLCYGYSYNFINYSALAIHQTTSEVAPKHVILLDSLRMFSQLNSSMNTLACVVAKLITQN